MYISKELSVHISSTQRNNTFDYSDIWHFFTQNANFCGKYLIIAKVQRKSHLRSSLTQIFLRSIVRTWVQAVFRQKPSLVDQLGQPNRGLVFGVKPLELVSWLESQIKLPLEWSYYSIIHCTFFWFYDPLCPGHISTCISAFIFRTPSEQYPNTWQHGSKNLTIYVCILQRTLFEYKNWRKRLACPYVAAYMYCKKLFL